MAEGVLCNLASKALENLAKTTLREAASWWGARDDLKKLENSIRMIQARVLDAEKYQEEKGSDVIKEWLCRLRLVLYQADDLFDHILTVDSRNRRRKQNKEVCFFSWRSSPFSLNWKMAQEIKCIRQQLEAIESDTVGLNLPSYQHRVEPQHEIACFMKNRETASLVQAEDVIGRENDKEIIIEMLFSPKYDGERVTIIPIVGFGGLGKTTIAQLVFNDERVQNHFDISKWAHVPDKNDRAAVMGKIFNSFTGDEYHNKSLEELQSGIKVSIETNKYLLVLDDIWDDRGDRWIDLVNLLKCGKPGSKVIVTTRSNAVAKGIGTLEEAYILETLTDDQSWNLFERLALKPRQAENSIFNTLGDIGKEIVELCGNVPLSIKVVAGFLRSRATPDEWLYVRDSQRSKAQFTKGGDIMPILKLSYDDLSPALKQCFAYCSLFPKGHEFNRTKLVHLWMAQGYFEISSRDIGDCYFLELLRRNLFQDPQEDLEGNVERCKMHDLVHDLAQHVAGQDSMVLIESSSLLLRSLFLIASFELEGLVSRFQSLRVLSLKDMRIERVPESIWRLRHLRYLDLCYSGIKCLPQAITRLENLQTLNLYACLLLEELPRDFTKLPNLSHLTIAKSGLTALPSGFGKMTSLLELDEFIVGESNGVDSVPALNLTGNLHIKFCKWHNDVVSEAKRADLKDSHKLNNLTLTWTVEVEEASPDGRNKMLMYLQLPPNLRYLQLHYYNGDEMQCRWFDGLSKLVFVTISSCHSCTVLPHLSQLPHLKYVHLGMLDALEYVEDEDDIRVGANCGHSSHYFPALEVLELSGLPRLKEWTRPSRSGGERQQLRQKLLFPRLSQMEVVDCKELVSIPLAPKLESLSVCRCNGKLFKSNLESLDDQEASSTLFTSLKQLKIISIDNGLVSLSISSRLCKLEILGIGYCSQLRSLMIESLSSIQYIEITHCSSWTSILKGNFPFLETLTIRHCNEDDFEEEEERNTTSTRYWQGLTSLRSLELDNISKLKKLPTGIACLTELQMLTVGFLENLTTLPEEIGKLSLLSELRIFYCPKLVLLPLSLQGLSSLKILYIEGCPELKERYRKPDGQDYHLLQHIPDLQVGCYE